MSSAPTAKKPSKKKTVKKVRSTAAARKSAVEPVGGSATGSAAEAASGPAAKPAKQKAAKKAVKKVAKKAATRPAPAGARKPGPIRSLVVVESPAKAKTIKKYLGAGFTVKASVGHIKDLPKSKLSVDIDDHFTPHYEVIRGKSKVIKEIKDAAREADRIFLAPDPDREGEAIAFHIAEELGRRHADSIVRITFNEITKRAVQEAIANPQPLNRLKYESQQARRILDRIVGYQISPILWDKVRRGLSAGRVQSVAVRLIVNRETAIHAFVSEEYWSIEATMQAADCAPEAPAWTAKVIKQHGEKFSPTTQAEADAATQTLQKAEHRVAEISRRERRRRPSAPLITSKLQQDAANRLRFTAKRTMIIAQQLYEGVELGAEGSVALITYMRTDSTRISNDALAEVRQHIETTYGKPYVSEQPNVYRSKKSAQDAHEAIRPTSMAYPPERVKGFVSPEQYKLYALIWQTFVACQMAPAVYDQTTVDMAAAEFTLRTTGSIMKFKGFLAAQQDLSGQQDKDADPEAEAVGSGELPELTEGMRLNCQKVSPQQHFTQPPPRFSESSLVKELEDKGIGRPSTYATILSTIVTRNYVQKEEGRFRPTELGTLITGLLTESFPQVLDVEFTAHMEEQLDDVETGKVDWIHLLDAFYHGGFKASLSVAQETMRDVKREEIPTDHFCATCGSLFMIKWGRNGSFLACSGYPQCRNTRDYVRQADNSIKIVAEATTTELCPTCEGSMVVKQGRFGKFLACKKYPECKGTRPISIGVICPNACGGYLAERRSMRGRTFYGCSSYPKCTFAAWDRPMPGPCPQCASAYLIRKYSKRDGVTIKCPNKECDYARDPELDDQDAAAVSA